MARKIYYKIPDNGSNFISNEAWDEIDRIQHWYNSEFIWTAGKLGFRRYAVFPNTERKEFSADELQAIISKRMKELKSAGLNKYEIIAKLQVEDLIIVHYGGYFDNCIASGFTRVANNEWNAYLVCEFLLKISRLIPFAGIEATDDGQFIKVKSVIIQDGNLILRPKAKDLEKFRVMAMNRHVFSIVDSRKYDRHPVFTNNYTNYNSMEKVDKMAILKDWNWLGFSENYDSDGDDIHGNDLNEKVGRFKIRE